MRQVGVGLSSGYPQKYYGYPPNGVRFVESGQREESSRVEKGTPIKRVRSWPVDKAAGEWTLFAGADYRLFPSIR
jgi:hypothetical protein